ncbi:MAG: ribonuclease Z [Bacteroides sp.]|nr:ribonuclease Z [Bacteroides sp.]
MDQLRLNILGCGSATPSLRHMPSCQVLEHRRRLFMIDCGEGAQLQMMRMHLKMNRLNDIFISHLHGDHFLGLPGLLSTMALHEKGHAVTVHTFERGAELLKSMLDFIIGDTPFDLRFNIIDPTRRQTLIDDKSLTVTSFPLYHRVPAVGFIFAEKPKLRHIDGEMARFHGVPPYEMESIRRGADFVKPDGEVIPNAMLTTDASPSASYAYCTDTMFDRRVVASVRGVDTIFHDCTYGDESAHLAAPRGHSTARQAAEIARRAGAKRLILGHFSKRYGAEEELDLARQAAEEFSGEIILANEGQKLDL